MNWNKVVGNWILSQTHVSSTRTFEAGSLGHWELTYVDCHYWEAMIEIGFLAYHSSSKVNASHSEVKARLVHTKKFLTLLCVCITVCERQREGFCISWRVCYLARKFQWHKLLLPEIFLPTEEARLSISRYL